MNVKVKRTVSALLGLAALCLAQSAEAQFNRYVTAVNTPLNWFGTVDLGPVRGVRSAGAFGGGNWDVGVVYDDFQFLGFGAIDDIEIEAQHRVAPHPIDGGGPGPELVEYLLNVNAGANVGPVTDFDDHGVVHTDLLRATYNNRLGRVFIALNHDSKARNKHRIDVNPERNVARSGQPQTIEMLAGTDTLGPLQVALIDVADAVWFDQPQPLDVQIVATDSGDGPIDGFFAPGDAPGSFMQLETYVNPGQNPPPAAGLIALRLGLHDLQGQPLPFDGHDLQLNVAPDQQRFDAELVLPLAGIGEQRIMISGQVEEGQQIALSQVALQPMFDESEGANATPAEFNLLVDFAAHGPYDPAGSLWRTSIINDYDVYGDIDGNDVVDDGDLALWAAGFGIDSDAHRGDGDADGDGDVDGADYLMVQRHFGVSLSDLLPRGGAGPAGVASLSAVPEPATAVLLALAAALTALRRR